jgi:3-isopropylmalate/(R)-2-methylmalate dehydratase small subunit
MSIELLVDAPGHPGDGDVPEAAGMKPFTPVSGPAIPLMRANVDTDVIIRIERITQVAKEALGRYALEALRFLPDGSDNPQVVGNRPEFRGATALLAGPNFGCGSSREHAVWALQGMGLRCVIAPSFGDIFYSNCFQNGMLPIRLPMDVVERLAALCAAGAALLVDLRAGTITGPDGSITSFVVDARRREALLSGLDDIDLTLKKDEVIRKWQDADRARRPWAWPCAVAAGFEGVES